MINQGRLTQENKAAAIETLKRMAAYGKTKNIMVGAEPRGDDFVLLTEVIRAGGAHTNPDVGNFGAIRPTSTPASGPCFRTPTGTAI